MASTCALSIPRCLLTVLFLGTSFQQAVCVATNCSAGEYLSPSQVCQECPAGHITSEDGHTQTACAACAAGEWAPAPGMTECLKCYANSDSLPGSAYCSLDPPCSPCIDRTAFKVRAVLHGPETVPFWRAHRRALETAGKLLNVDFAVTLMNRNSDEEMMQAIEDAVADEADALIVTISNDVIANAVKTIAQEIPVFAFDSEPSSCRKAGVLVTYGQDEESVAAEAADRLVTAFSERGMAMTACIAINADWKITPLERRRDGIRDHAVELGIDFAEVVLSFVDVPASQASLAAAISTYMNSSNFTAGGGLGIMLLGGGPLFGVSKAVVESFNSDQIIFGVFDLEEGVDEGFAAGTISFAIDQAAWMQDFMSVVTAVMYITTGNLPATHYVKTGGEFFTAARSEAEILRAAEAYPVCDCKWVAGQEDQLVCDDVAIGDCPYPEGLGCTAPCMDIRQMRLRGALPAIVSDAFWFPVQAGAQQAANDLRLIDYDLPWFQRAFSGDDDSYSDDGLKALIDTYANDDSVDAFYVAAQGSFATANIKLAASMKPVISTIVVNGTSDAFALDGGSDSYYLGHVGQPEYQAGLKLASAIISAGATHVACMITDPAHYGLLRRCAGVEAVFAEQNYSYTALDMIALGAQADSDPAIQDAVVAGLTANPSINAIVTMGFAWVAPTVAARTVMGKTSDELLIASFDIGPVPLENLDAGEVLLLVDQVPYLEAYFSVMFLAIYHITGYRPAQDLIPTGPNFIYKKRSNWADCLNLKWSELDEDGDPVVGESFLPRTRPNLATGFPVCERLGRCSDGAYFDFGTCRPCPAGTHRNGTMLECETCPAGTSTGGMGGSPECTFCGEGTYAITGEASCHYCPRGSYASAQGTSACEVCAAPFTTNDIASNDLSACLCPEGMMGVESLYAEGGRCVPCPDAMACAFGSHELDYSHIPEEEFAPRNFPQVLFGYMTLASMPFQPFECINLDACPGGATASCAHNHDPSKVACADCLPGYYEEGSRCEICGSVWSPQFVGAILVGMICLIGVALFSNSGSHMRSQSSFMVVIMASLMFTNFQALSVFDTLSFEWFEPLSSVFKLSSIMSMDVQLVRAGCVIKFDDATRFVLLQLAAPLAMFVCYLVLLFKKHCGIPGFATPNSNIRLELVTTVGSLLGMFFISLMMSALAPFICYKHPGEVGSSVRSAPAILCNWEGRHQEMLVSGVVAALLVPLPFVANAIHVTYRYSRSMALEVRRDVLLKYRFLFFRFHPHAFFYGLILIFRSLAICLVPVVIRDDAGMQIFVLCLIVASFSQFQCWLKPWRAELCNVIDALLSLLLMSMLVCAPMATGLEANRTPLRILGFSAFCCMVALGGSMFGLAGLKICRNTPKYDLFLCHYKREASAQVRYIKATLTSNTSAKVFIDSDNLVNLDGLFDTVKQQVGTFVVFLTASTLTRSWCCGEIVSAFAAKVKVKRVETKKFAPPTLEQLANLGEYINLQDSPLGHYGICLDTVKAAFNKLLDPAIHTIRMDCIGVSGTLACPWVADELVGRRGRSTSRSQADDLTAVIVSVSSTNEEALAAAGYIILKLNEAFVTVCGFGTILCLADCDIDDKKLGYKLEEASAVVVLLSGDTMTSPSEIQTITRIMDTSRTAEAQEREFCVIPANLPDFLFPGKSYFEETLPSLFTEIKPTDLAALSEGLTSCFKLIAVNLPMAASEEVLSTQVWSIFMRMAPRTYGKGTSLTTSTSRRARKPSGRSEGSRTTLSSVKDDEKSAGLVESVQETMSSVPFTTSAETGELMDIFFYDKDAVVVAT